MLLQVMVVATTAALSAASFSMSDQFIDDINAKATTWTAGRNFPQNTSIEYFKRLMGVRRGQPPVTIPQKSGVPSYLLNDLPSEFDSRTKWPNCSSLNEIRDQGNCGSCWAEGATEVMTDRTCIHSNGSVNFHYSVENLMSCCTICMGGNGCDGGFPPAAFDYWLHEGITSGGPYNSSKGCQPYSVEPCEHHSNGTRPSCQDTPHHKTTCKHKCQAAYGKDYSSDLRKAAKVYVFSNYELEKVMHDIMTNGPVSADFYVFADFLSYKSGVYQHTSGGLLGGHAIKILGWGEENGVKYWLCANSWNSDWGDKGFFKFLRGVNHCMMEENILGGIPDLN